MNPAIALTPARRFELIFLFGALTVFTPIAIDMYLPALPTIAGDFHVSIAAIEHSLAVLFRWASHSARPWSGRCPTGSAGASHC